jgi:hypothetical protein
MDPFLESVFFYNVETQNIQCRIIILQRYTQRPSLYPVPYVFMCSADEHRSTTTLRSVVAHSLQTEL